MSTPTRIAAAALLAAVAAGAAAAHAQTYGQGGYAQGPNQGGYNQGGYGQGADRGAGAQGYDRNAYPASTYDRGAQSGYPQSGYDADRGGQGADAASGQADDPEVLARRLNLTPSQRGAFAAYRDAFRPDEGRARQEDADMQRMATLSTPQRLDLARASLQRDRADFDRTDQATRAFYAQLSPGQRRTFDQLTAPQQDDGQNGPSPTQPAAPSGPR